APILKGSKRNACSRLPDTATTIEGLSIWSSRPASRRLGWNNISRRGPASIWCQPLLSSGIACCIRTRSIALLLLKKRTTPLCRSDLALPPSLQGVEAQRAAGQYLVLRLGGQRPE